MIKESKVLILFFQATKWLNMNNPGEVPGVIHIGLFQSQLS
jgi:hypothetical protein